MNALPAQELSRRKPLRLWPGVALVVLQWVLRFGVPVVYPDALPVGVIGALVCGFLVLVWWLFFSRAPWSERIGATVVLAVAMFAASRLSHESIAKGAMGMLLPILAVPIVSLALVAWAVLTRNLSDRTRRAAMVTTMFAASGLWTLVRTEGFTGDFDNELKWRWTKSPEEILLSQPRIEPKAPAPAPQTSAPTAAEATVVTKARLEPSIPPSTPTAPAVEWLGFRGPGRDSAIPGVRIVTDWASSPPVKLWKRPIGPGWSSFAVRGDLIYTQEQRGPEEMVACYRLSTGEPVWMHSDTARFWESNAGAGPRGTPTLHGDRVYTFGATGIVNALNADSGTVVWSRNAANDTDTKVPEWGFSSSPLVVDDAVVVAASGKLVAYDVAKGVPRWFGQRRGGGYSSPHLVTIQGVPQIVLLSGKGAVGVAPKDGKVLWEHDWAGYPIVQPAVTANGDLLISVSNDSGTRRLAIAQGSGGWNVEERWTSNGLKPYFNDFVVHKGHAFGFDGSILACINLEDGKRKWKGGRYGHGQLVLLPDQDLLLVLSEEGQLALVKAVADGFTEVAKAPAIEGKTWNHPVLAGDVLLARNGEEMAAFRLKLTGR